MINFVVENLNELLVELKREGVSVIGEIKEDEFGKFAWVVDPEGNKIELWEPPK
jgi:predicted enzyme related to lactoylglutathione lyase